MSEQETNETQGAEEAQAPVLEGKATPELPATEPEVVAPEAAAAPNEPDRPADPQGIITKLSPEAYKNLVKAWKGKGSPSAFETRGMRFQVFTDGDGMKFVLTANQGGMDLYNSLSYGG